MGRRGRCGAVRGVARLVGALWVCGCACAPAEAPRGIVLVVVDALRADRLGCYGYGGETSPHLDAMARRGVRFERAMAPSPWTLPSLATLMTGMSPFLHGAISTSPVDRGDWLSRPAEFRPVDALHPSRTTLAEVLQAHGFATWAAVQGSYASTPFGIAQGFDRYDDNRTAGVRFDVESFFAWLDEEAPERFFAYLHVLEVHSPYQPPQLTPHFLRRRPEVAESELRHALEEERALFERFDPDPDYEGLVTGSRFSIARMRELGDRLGERNRRRLSQIYDRGVRYADHWIGALVEGLRARDRAATTWLIVTSDHGEELFDHGGLEHGHTFYDELLRVPLVIEGPGVRPGQVVEAQVSLEDVMPTVLEALGLPMPEAVTGRSLLPALSGDPIDSRDVVAEASYLPGAIALRTPQQKLVIAPRRLPLLFDLERDPGERRDACREQRDRCSDLTERLRGLREEQAALAARLALSEAEAAVIDDAVAERLRALGYALDSDAPGVRAPQSDAPERSAPSPAVAPRDAGDPGAPAQR